MLGNLLDLKKKAEEVKKRLESITVEGEAANGSVKVVATADQKIQSVKIDRQLMADGETDQLEELLVVAANRALDASRQVMQAEMAAVYKGALPGMF